MAEWYSSSSLDWWWRQNKQFEENLVQRLRDHPEITYRHIPTQENWADLASRGADIAFSTLWGKDLEWVADSECWPPQQAILCGKLMTLTDYVVLEKFELSKAMTVCALVHDLCSL